MGKFIYTHAKLYKRQGFNQGSYYFTALATHCFDASKRHEKYISALKVFGVETVYGKFKVKYPRCKNCNNKYKTHEEKESDINIAIKMLQHAYEDQFDTAYLVTADSDLVSTIKTIKELFPNKYIVLLVPPTLFRYSVDLRNNTHKFYEIKKKHIARNLLPDYITLDDEIIIKKPQEYNS